VNLPSSKSPDGLREIVRAVMQEMLETEMTDTLGAEKGERTTARLGYPNRAYVPAKTLRWHKTIVTQKCGANRAKSVPLLQSHFCVTATLCAGSLLLLFVDIFGEC
jgi:hypothetical protein